MRPLRSIAVLVALAGCASSRQPRVLNMEVFEAQPAHGRILAQGHHAFVVRLTNLSAESVTILSVGLSTTHEQIQIYNGDQEFRESIEPGKNADFRMEVDVDVFAPAISRSVMSVLDSVNVAVTCHSNSKGAFTESTTQRVVGD